MATAETEYVTKTNDSLTIEQWLPGDLREGTVEFSMKPVVARGNVTVSEQDATVEEYDGERGDAGESRVQYTIQPAALSEAGEYFGEFEATYPDGDVVTFPKGKYYFIKVRGDIV